MVESEDSDGFCYLVHQTLDLQRNTKTIGGNHAPKAHRPSQYIRFVLRSRDTDLIGQKLKSMSMFLDCHR